MKAPRINLRELEVELAELERTDPAVRAAAEKLERVKSEILDHPQREPVHSPRAFGVYASWTHTFCGLLRGTATKVQFASGRVTCPVCIEARAEMIRTRRIT